MCLINPKISERHAEMMDYVKLYIVSFVICQWYDTFIIQGFKDTAFNCHIFVIFGLDWCIKMDGWKIMKWKFP